MHLPTREKLPHAVPQWVSDRDFFFITLCCRVRGTNQLCTAERGTRILSTVEFYHQNGKWHCRLFLLMPDHAHGVIAFPREPGLQSVVKAWKAYATRSNGVEWQEGFFDYRLRSDAEANEKVSYVLNNPVRAGLCKLPEEWPFVYRPNDRVS